jgi:hypothetical protein
MEVFLFQAAYTDFARIRAITAALIACRVWEKCGRRDLVLKSFVADDRTTCGRLTSAD